jgi:uncharacterized protein
VEARSLTAHSIRERKINMRKLTPFLVATALLGLTDLRAAEPEASPADPAMIRAMIVSGVGGRVHVWKDTTAALRQVLEEDKRFRVTGSETSALLASDELSRFDVLILNFSNFQPADQEVKARTNLAQLVSQGKGLVVVHFASGAFKDWPEFRNLVGRTQQLRHDNRGPFTVKIVNPNHPITRGVGDFQTDDELFIELTGDRPITVLAEARSNVTGTDHPMAFVFDYGKGHVFHTPLGHDARAIRMPGTAELIRRGAVWAAKCSMGLISARSTTNMAECNCPCPAVRYACRPANDSSGALPARAN